MTLIINSAHDTIVWVLNEMYVGIGAFTIAAFGRPILITDYIIHISQFLKNSNFYDY